MIRSRLSTHQVTYFKELFQIIDKEHDGNVTFKELYEVVGALGLECTEMHMQEMINRADLDGNGCIDFDEFVEVLAQKLMEEANVEEYREVFHIFDKDYNGFITSSELRSIYLALGLQISDDELEKLILDADCDGDGIITFEEFVGMMTSLKR